MERTKTIQTDDQTIQKRYSSPRSIHPLNPANRFSTAFYLCLGRSRAPGLFFRAQTLRTQLTTTSSIPVTAATIEFHYFGPLLSLRTSSPASGFSGFRTASHRVLVRILLSFSALQHFHFFHFLFSSSARLPRISSITRV